MFQVEKRFGLEVLSLKTKWYHRDQRVALRRLRASEPKSDDLPNKKPKPGSKTHNWLEAAPKLLKNTKGLLLGWHHHELGDHPDLGRPDMVVPS